jgi:hypothetical protein
MDGIRPIGRCRTGNLGRVGTVTLGAVDRVDGPALETEHGSAAAGAMTVSGMTTEAAVALVTTVATSRVKIAISACDDSYQSD